MSPLKRALRLTVSLSIILSLVIGLSAAALAANSSLAPVSDPTAETGTVTKLAVTFYGDPASSKGFTWYTTAKSINSDLQVVEKNAESADYNASNVLKFTGTTAVPTNLADTTVNKKQEYLHKAEASGLKANTTYFFRAGDASLGLWSDIGTFQTAPAGGAFTFLDLADPQAKELDEAELSAQTFQKAAATVPDAKFIVLNGDVVDTGSLEYQWDWLFENMKQVLQNYTIAPVAGNHEKQPSSFIDHFDLSVAPGSPTTSGAYYSYDYSNTHFVLLNNNENSTEYNDFTPAQIQWLKTDVQQARANGAQWIIAVLHKGPYTTSNHATDSDIAGPNGVRNKVAPIFAELGIDLILQGHDHIYARSKPIKADGTASAETVITESFNGQNIPYQVNPDGSIYLIPSTAGPKVYYKNTSIDPNYYDLFDVNDENHAAPYGSDPADPSRPVRSQIQNFGRISVDGGKLSVISYEIDQNKNNAQPYVIDTFGIIKDKTAPVISVQGVADGDKVKLNAQKTVTWTAADDLSGIKSAVGDIPSSAQLDTSTAGVHTLHFIATDYAGNTSTKTITYDVEYDYSGVLNPINSDGSSTFQGSAVPVKFQLKDANGAYVTNATAKLYIAKVTGNTAGTEAEAVSAAGASIGNAFRYDSTNNQYIFNLNVKGFDVGTYQLRIDLGDGTVNKVTIGVK